jgi:hypothetical protein
MGIASAPRLVLRSNAAFQALAALLVLAGSACSEHAQDPTEPLSDADPGYLLSVTAPAYGGLTDWDLLAGQLVVGEQLLWAVDLATHVATPLPLLVSGIAPAIQYLRVAPASGTIFMTTEDHRTSTLIRLDRGAAQSKQVAGGSGSQFVLSPDGHWLIYFTDQETRYDTRSEERATLTSSFPLAVDDDGTHMAVRACNLAMPCEFAVLDIETGTKRVFVPPRDYSLYAGTVDLDVAFVAHHLTVLQTRDVASGLEFYEWDEAAGTERVLGTIAGRLVGYSCYGWSPANHSLVGVFTHGEEAAASRQRFGVYSLFNGTSTMIRTADLGIPVGCNLSADGKWFTYGNSTGLLIGPGRSLYLTPVP